MRFMTPMLVAGLLFLAGPTSEVLASGKLTAARELAEAAIRRFGGKATTEGAEALTKRIVSAGARYGDDVVEAAVRRIGPRALSLADDAGEQGAKALKLLAAHGDDAAVWVIARPNAMRLLAEHGDDTARLLIAHKGVAEPILEGFGRTGAEALKAVGPQNGRRLGMLLQSGELAKMGRADEVMKVIGRYGDRACDFVWRNKGALAVGTALAAFLANPEAAMNGAGKVAGAAIEHGFKPVVGATGEAAKHAVDLLAYALSLVGVVGVAAGVLAAKNRPFRAAMALAGKLCLRRLARPTFR